MTGAELRAARLKLGAAQIDVSRVFNVSEWSVWAWERGIHPVPSDIKLSVLRRLVGKHTQARQTRSTSNRARGLLRWMRENPDLVRQRNQRAATKLSREDRRALGKLTWAGTSHAERSRIATKRQRRRWAKVPKRERSQYIAALNRLRWASVPKPLRSKLMSEMQKAAWARLSASERSLINSERVRDAWAKLTAAQRSELMRERFWTWFPQCDPETRARVMKVLRLTGRAGK
jgi:hypothetical protein